MTCGGACCAAFPYTSTPETLRARWAKWPDTSQFSRDDLFIADMLIEITPAEASARLAAAGATLPEDPNLNMVKWAEGIEEAGGSYPLYTCRHWDPETRLCTVYEERPQMCRDYPYDGQCNADCACSYKPPTEVRTKWQAIRVRNAAKSQASA